MLNVGCDNKITVTRNDKGFLNFRCANYKLIPGDKVIFEVKALGVYKEVEDFTEKGIAVIELDNFDTNYEKCIYNYTIQVITKNGIEDTVINGKYVII